MTIALFSIGDQIQKTHLKTITGTSHHILRLLTSYKTEANVWSNPWKT